MCYARWCVGIISDLWLCTDRSRQLRHHQLRQLHTLSHSVPPGTAHSTAALLSLTSPLRIDIPLFLSQIGSLSGNTLPIGIVVLGVFILFLALLGGVSAYRESRIFLLVYFVFLLLLTLILFFVGIAVYVERNDASTYISQGWSTAPPDLKQSLQQIFQCCGCCDAGYQPQNATATQPACDASTSPTMTGCLPVFVSYFQSYYVTAGGCGIAFAVIMFMGMLLVCFLMKGIKDKRAEQDLAKLRASNNVVDDGEVQLTMGGGRKGATDDDEEEGEEEEEEEVEEEEED